MSDLIILTYQYIFLLKWLQDQIFKFHSTQVYISKMCKKNTITLIVHIRHVVAFLSVDIKKHVCQNKHPVILCQLFFCQFPLTSTTCRNVFSRTRGNINSRGNVFLFNFCVEIYSPQIGWSCTL